MLGISADASTWSGIGTGKSGATGHETMVRSSPPADDCIGVRSARFERGSNDADRQHRSRHDDRHHLRDRCDDERRAGWSLRVDDQYVRRCLHRRPGHHKRRPSICDDQTGGRRSGDGRDGGTRRRFPEKRRQASTSGDADRGIDVPRAADPWPGTDVEERSGRSRVVCAPHADRHVPEHAVQPHPRSEHRRNPRLAPGMVARTNRARATSASGTGEAVAVALLEGFHDLHAHRRRALQPDAAGLGGELGDAAHVERVPGRNRREHIDRCRDDAYVPAAIRQGRRPHGGGGGDPRLRPHLRRRFPAGELHAWILLRRACPVHSGPQAEHTRQAGG